MMDALTDIRILKLAQMYEQAYEAFVVQMAKRYVQNPAIQAKLALLMDPADGHGERISAAIDRLTAKLGEADREQIERAALQDVLEVERSARAFYLQFVEEIHDPEVAALFRALAREEARHIRIAEDAMSIHDKKASRVHLSPEMERVVHQLDGADHALPW